MSLVSCLLGSSFVQKQPFELRTTVAEPQVEIPRPAPRAGTRPTVLTKWRIYLECSCNRLAPR